MCLSTSSGAISKAFAYASLYKSGPVPASYSLNAFSFHSSPASHASIRPSMFDKSLTTSFLPVGAIMQPRNAELVSSMILSNSRSAHPAFSASMPSSICSCFSEGRGRFWGWNSRPAQRPVRDAPQNCSVPRKRPSWLTPFISALYLLVLVVLACRRIASSSFTADGKSGSAIRRSRVLRCMSGSSTP